MLLPVVKRVDKKEFDISYIDLNDVLFTFIEGGIVKYQTSEEVYSQISTLEEQEKFLSSQGFEKLERGYLVHMDKLEWYDEDTSQVYFDKYPSKKSPCAPVSRVHRKDIPEDKVKNSSSTNPNQVRLNYLNG